MTLTKVGNPFIGIARIDHPLKIPLFIFFIAFTLRLILVHNVTPYPERYAQADGAEYDQLARNLLAGRGFSMEASAPFIPDNFRTPGYPVILAASYALFGYHPPAMLYVQAFIGALTCLVTYFLAARWAGHPAGLLSSLLVAVSPHSITYTALLWSETVFTFLLTVSIFLTIEMVTRSSRAWVILSGFTLGLTTLIHPRTLYLPVIFTIVLCGIYVLNKKGWQKALVHTSLYLCFLLVPLLPWVARNYLVFGVPNLTAVQGINLLHYGAALTESNVTGTDQWKIVERYENKIQEAHPEPLNEAEYANVAFRYALEKIRDHPLVFAKVHFIGMMKVFLPGTFTINNLITGQTEADMREVFGVFVSGSPAEYGIFQRLNEFSKLSWGIIGFETITLGISYLLALYTILFDRRTPWKWSFVLTIIYLVLVAGPVGAPRFRVALMPLISILASMGAVAIFQRYKDASGKLSQLWGESLRQSGG